ncbi:sensor histidine kinase [Dyadobacter diqingensis]|uniref:sensor histidine kinase n=1 Tax=Dyadobacter diqingensis TaxID=2938121 RepID=UPI0020C5B2BF|nr:HAMP domain-containing sensor histidine kinase [Dyadobacter diqingensis]
MKSIVSDDFGFIWLETEKGLARFDGQRVLDMTKLLGSAAGRSHDFIPGLSGDRKQIFAFKWDQPPIRLEGGKAITDSSYQLQRMLNLSGIVDVKSLVAQDIPGLTMGNVGHGIEKLHYFVSGSRGCSYVVTRQEIMYYSDSKLRWKKRNNFPQLLSFFVMGDGLCYLNQDGTVVKCTEKSWDQITISGDARSDKDWNTVNVEKQLFASTINQQAFLMIGDRFYILKPLKGNVWTTELLLEGFSFMTNRITSVYFDRQSGNLLLGSVTRGLFVIRKKRFSTMTYDQDDMNNVFYSQTPLDSNNILLAGRKILGVRKSGNKLHKLIKTLPGSTSVLPTDTRYSVRDKSGRIWMSAGGALLVFTQDGTRQLRRFLTKSRITTLYEKFDGEIVVGCSGLGLFTITLDALSFKPFFNPEHLPDVLTILHLDKSNLLLGTEGGLYRLNLSTNTKELIYGTEKLCVRSLYIRNGGKKGVFFTTLDNGVFFYDSQGVVNFPLDANQYLAAAHCIVEDSKGYFWITTNRGLFQVHVDDLYDYVNHSRNGQTANLFYLYYDKGEGFNTNEFNGGCFPCAVRMLNGLVSLPSMSGLVIFEPEKIKPLLPNRPLVIDWVEEHNVASQISGDTVRLTLNPRNVSFHLNTPFYGNPDNLHFSYALMRGTDEPGNADWVTVDGAQPVARFSEIASGEHTLWVRKAEGFGLNRFIVQQLSVSVPLNWYETLWFKQLVVFAVIALVYIIVRARTRMLRARNQMLEISVAERTRNLQELLVSLQTSEKELSRQMQLQSRLIASISHDVCTPINYFAMAADMAENMVHGEQNKEARQVMKDLSHSARHIYNFVDNLLNFSKIQSYELHTKARAVSVHKLIGEKIQIFATALAQRGISLHNEIPVDLEIVTSPQLLGIMAHNLIDNSLKHSNRNTVVRVKAESRGDGMHLIFSNSGKGLPGQILVWLNTPRQENNAQSLPDEFTGLGLLIIKETSEILNVKLFAENNDGANIHLIF